MSFSPTKLQLDRVESISKGVPFTAYDYVTVNFPSAANTDYDIAHSLSVANPELIDYEVVRKDRACDVYNDTSGTRRLWRAGYITLRCNTASAVVVLRLSARRA